MTTTDAQLKLHPPVWARVWVVAFPTMVVIVSLSGVVPLRGNPGWAARLLICVFAAALGWRLFRLAAIGMPDGRLVVRNHWRDQTVHRDDIAEVIAGRIAGAPNRSVHLRLLDGSTVRLDVTEVPFVGPGRRRLERQTEEVRAWLSGRPQPFR